MGIQEHQSSVIYQQSIVGQKEVAIAADWYAGWYVAPNEGRFDAYYLPHEMKIGPFLRQGMKAGSIELRERHNEVVAESGFQGLIPFFVFAIVVFTKALYPRRFTQLLTAPFSNQAQWQLLREWNPLNNGISYLYSTLYFVSFALFIQLAANSFGSSPLILGSRWLDLLVLSAGIGFIILGKYVTIMFLALIFNARASGERYLTTQITFSLISLITLIPILLLMYYQPGEASLLFGAALFGFVQLIRMIRSLRVGLTENSFGFIYLFLYLCALEIIPLLIVLKVLHILTTNGVIH